MAKKLTNPEKITILKDLLLPMLCKSIDAATVELQTARDNYIALTSIDGDKDSVKKAPILSVVEGQVSVQMAQDTIKEIKRLLNS